MHSNSVLEATAWDRIRVLRRQFSRRALRHKPEDEFKDFACWIRRDPGSIAGANYGGMGQGFWDEVDPPQEQEYIPPQQHNPPGPGPIQNFPMRYAATPFLGGEGIRPLHVGLQTQSRSMLGGIPGHPIRLDNTIGNLSFLAGPVIQQPINLVLPSLPDNAPPEERGQE
jgi:hypothetical protein